MHFSDFIKDCLLGRNNIAWNYYQCTGINTDNILYADTSAEFIREYFTYGGKELPLLLNPEDVTAFMENHFLFTHENDVFSFGFDEQYVKCTPCQGQF